MEEISIVIPAYNEEKRIGATLEKVLSYCRRKRYDYEIIVVDDGSKDETANIVKGFNDKNVFLVGYGQNKGKGFAVRVGMLRAKKNRVLFSDADLSTPIEELDKFFVRKEDIVIGSRNLESSQITIKQPFIRQKLGRMFPAIVEFVLPLGIKDTQCGFKLFTKEAARGIFRKIQTNGFGFDVECLYLGRRMGYSIAELPVEWRNAAGSKVNIARDAPRMLFDTIRIRMTHR